MWSDDWVIFNNHTYKYFADQAITGHRADQQCQDKGTLLVSINSEEEAEFVGNGVLRKRTLSAYIGGSDEDRGNTCIKLLFQIN